MDEDARLVDVYELLLVHQGEELCLGPVVVNDDKTMFRWVREHPGGRYAINSGHNNGWKPIELYETVRPLGVTLEA